jgi:hypothetical protein
MVCYNLHFLEQTLRFCIFLYVTAGFNFYNFFLKSYETSYKYDLVLNLKKTQIRTKIYNFCIFLITSIFQANKLMAACIQLLGLDITKYG